MVEPWFGNKLKIDLKLDWIIFFIQVKPWSEQTKPWLRNQAKPWLRNILDFKDELIAVEKKIFKI